MSGAASRRPGDSGFGPGTNISRRSEWDVSKHKFGTYGRRWIRCKGFGSSQPPMTESWRRPSMAGRLRRRTCVRGISGPRDPQACVDAQVLAERLEPLVACGAIGGVIAEGQCAGWSRRRWCGVFGVHHDRRGYAVSGAGDEHVEFGRVPGVECVSGVGAAHGGAGFRAGGEHQPAERVRRVEARVRHVRAGVGSGAGASGPGNGQACPNAQAFAERLEPLLPRWAQFCRGRSSVTNRSTNSSNGALPRWYTTNFVRPASR